MVNRAFPRGSRERFFLLLSRFRQFLSILPSAFEGLVLCCSRNSRRCFQFFFFCTLRLVGVRMFGNFRPFRLIPSRRRNQCRRSGINIRSSRLEGILGQLLSLLPQVSALIEI